jgi:hypothetical protein
MNTIEFIGRSVRDFMSCREEVSYHSPKDEGRRRVGRKVYGRRNEEEIK